jgi:hypothetical protein
VSSVSLILVAASDELSERPHDGQKRAVPAIGARQCGQVTVRY